MIKMVFAFEYDFDTKLFMFGNDMALPWGHIPEDLKLFKEYTTDKGDYDNEPVLVMGHKTYETIKNNGLEKTRKLIVLTSKDIQDTDRVEFLNVDDMVSFKRRLQGMDNNVFIIGGKGLLEEFFDITDEISLSYILNNKGREASVADTFLDRKFMQQIFIKFKEVGRDNNMNDHSFIRLIMKRNKWARTKIY